MPCGELAALLGLGALAGLLAASLQPGFAHGRCGDGSARPLAGGIARRRDRRRGRGSSAWFAPELVGGGDEITQSVLAGGATLALIPLGFSAALRLGAVSYAAATPGGPVRPDARSRGAARAFLRRSLPLAFPGLGVSPGSIRRCRHGRLLHRGRAGSGYRHRTRHRDDRGLHDAAADDRGRVLRRCWSQTCCTVPRSTNSLRERVCSLPANAEAVTRAASARAENSH